MLRLFALHRSERGVNKTIRNYTSLDSATQLFTVPPREQLEKYAVVVTTTRAAAMLANAAEPQRHFTHIIVDEAAQLMECKSVRGRDSNLRPLPS